ncbi:MAG: hypothetical protein KA758_00830 [Acidimicrobiales bacterium]|nr:hypothetical protein [Acidimicrobiales bacterium]
MTTHEPDVSAPTRPADPGRPTSHSVALGAFVAAILVAVPVLFHAGRHQWFFLDEFDFLAGRDLRDVRDLFRPHNEHWTTPPIVIYRILFWLVGLRSYTPYLALAITAHLASACLLRVVTRRSGVDPWLATAAIIPWVFFGTGNENILWGFQFTLGTSLLLGLLHVLAADHDGPVGRRDLLGLGAGLLAIMSSGIGLVMVLAASGTALGRRGWRAALVHAGPLAVIYLCWWIVAEPSTGVPAGEGDVVGQALAIVTGAWNGIAGSTIGGVVFAVVAGTGLVLTARATRTTGHPGLGRLAAPVALAGSALAFAGLTAYSRAALGSEPASRYLHIAAALLLPLLAVGTQAIVSRWPKLLPVGAGMLLIGLPANVDRLGDRNPFVLGDRTSTLTLAAVAHDEDVKRSVQPWAFWNPEVTAGWLADGIESGRIPGPESIDPAMRQAASLRLSLQVLPPDDVGTCSTAVPPVPLRLDEGDVVRFGGSSAAVVEVLGDEQTPPLQVLGVTTDRGETIDAVYVRAERPVLLDQTPDAPWGAVALCD